MSCFFKLRATPTFEFVRSMALLRGSVYDDAREGSGTMLGFDIHMVVSLIRT